MTTKTITLSPAAVALLKTYLCFVDNTSYEVLANGTDWEEFADETYPEEDEYDAFCEAVKELEAATGVKLDP